MAKFEYKIVIPTIRGYEIAYNHLRKSLRNAGVSDDEIITVYGKEEADKIDGNNIYIRNNLYEYNALIGIHNLDVKSNTVFLLLHDTCEVGPLFLPKLNDLVDRYTEGIFWACPGGQCNLCLFSKEVADITYAQIGTMLTISKMDAIRMEHNNHHLSLKRYNVTQSYSNLKQSHLPPVLIYSNVRRNRIYYPSLDLTKYYVYIDKDSEHPQKP